MPTSRALETTMTQKGQVTVPAEIRARLGLKPRDRVRFEVHGAEVTLKPAPSRIARHFGAARVSGLARDWRQERDAFEAGVAADVAAEDR
ncbi:MAG: AbrB/MazE/SpoVT family DNA-binding domain-containing protein [Chloroflexi bacterium]|nr:AbrB/MazE/SpoVT family DNA-binding domain-containing protein [Chloroflexota bacterium]